MRARCVLPALALVVATGCGSGTATPVETVTVTVTVTATPTVDRNSAGYRLAAADRLGADPAAVDSYQRLAEEAADGCGGTVTQLAAGVTETVGLLADRDVRTSAWALLADVARRAGQGACTSILLAYNIGQLPVPAYALPR